MRNERDRCKILVRVEWRRFVQCGCDCQRASAEHERIAVRGGSGERLDADHGACARAVLDHDRHSHAIGKLRPDDAGQHVVAAARGERRDQSDRSVWVILRRCLCLQGKDEACHRQKQSSKSHVRP